MSAKLIQVIEVDELVGKGKDDDPYRRITVYYSTDGNLLAWTDAWQEQVGKITRPLGLPYP